MRVWKKPHACDHFSLDCLSSRLPCCHSCFRAFKKIFVKYCYWHESHGEFQWHCGRVYLGRLFTCEGGIYRIRLHWEDGKRGLEDSKLTFRQ